MFWTHIYDLTGKFVCLLIAVVLAISLPGHDNEILQMVIIFILIPLLYFSIFRTLGSYLYCKLRLKMELNFSEAKKLNAALSPLLLSNFKWLPLTEVKTLEPSIKYEAALKLCEEWEKENKNKLQEHINKFNLSSPKTKLFNILVILLIVFFGIASVMNIPPASYVTQGYQLIFGPEGYNPLVNFILLALATILIAKKLNKNIL